MPTPFVPGASPAHVPGRRTRRRSRSRACSRRTSSRRRCCRQCRDRARGGRVQAADRVLDGGRRHDARQHRRRHDVVSGGPADSRGRWTKARAVVRHSDAAAVLRSFHRRRDVRRVGTAAPALAASDACDRCGLARALRGRCRGRSRPSRERSVPCRACRRGDRDAPARRAGDGPHVAGATGGVGALAWNRGAGRRVGLIRRTGRRSGRASAESRGRGLSPCAR